MLLHFTKQLSELETELPKLFQRKGVLQALHILALADPAIESELDLDFLSMDGKTRLVTSPLWAGFMEARFEAKVAVAVACRAPASEQQQSDDSRLLLAGIGVGR